MEDDADSAKMLRHLELIDGEASEYGVRIVKLDDALMAKKYGHRDPVKWMNQIIRIIDHRIYNAYITHI